MVLFKENGHLDIENSLSISYPVDLSLVDHMWFGSFEGLSQDGPGLPIVHQRVSLACLHGLHPTGMGLKSNIFKWLVVLIFTTVVFGTFVNCFYSCFSWHCKSSVSFSPSSVGRLNHLPIVWFNLVHDSSRLVSSQPLQISVVWKSYDLFHVRRVKFEKCIIGSTLSLVHFIENNCVRKITWLKAIFLILEKVTSHACKPWGWFFFFLVAIFNCNFFKKKTIKKVKQGVYFPPPTLSSFLIVHILLCPLSYVVELGCG